MMPTVGQQLLSIKRRLEETILPELAPDAAFAREQARYVLMALDFLVDTHEHAYRYAVVENLQYRQALAEMAALASPQQAGPDLTALLDQPGPAESDARLLQSEMAQHTDQLKSQLTRLYQRLTARDGTESSAATQIMKRLAERQVAREMAFFAPSGFTTSERSLTDILGDAPLPIEGAPR